MVSPRHADGFSLIELIFALAIIGIMTAAIAPSLSEVLADNREVSAAVDVVRIARKARALTSQTGNAHMLDFVQSDSNDLGVIHLYAGMNGKCRQTPTDQWAILIPSTTDRMHQVESINMAFYNPVLGNVPKASDRNRQVIKLRARAGGNPETRVQICLQPDGDAYVATPPSQTTLVRQSADVVLSVLRSVNDTPRGQDREIVFPPGGTARAR